MMFNQNTVLAMLLLTAPSVGGTDVEGADTNWTSNRIARTRKLKKANSGGGGDGGGTSASTAPDWLFLQAGIKCRITQHAATGIYHLSATVGNTTTAFTERPDRLAGTIFTQVFVKTFKDIFATSNPNAAVTFTSTTAEAAASNGPLIVELSQPRVNNKNYIEYPITQSISQGEVGSLDQFMGMSDVSCSIFVDSGTLMSNNEIIVYNPSCELSVGSYVSNGDYCFTCGSGASLTYCWNNQDCPPNCDSWNGVGSIGDGNCGLPCENYWGDNINSELR